MYDFVSQLRMQRHEENSLRAARFLETHPAVERVKHPQLTSHPEHELAKRMIGDRYCGMIALYLKGGDQEARKFLKEIKVQE